MMMAGPRPPSAAGKTQDVTSNGLASSYYHPETTAVPPPPPTTMTATTAATATATATKPTSHSGTIAGIHQTANPINDQSMTYYSQPTTPIHRTDWAVSRPPLQVNSYSTGSAFPVLYNPTKPRPGAPVTPLAQQGLAQPQPKLAPPAVKESRENVSASLHALVDLQKHHLTYADHETEARMAVKRIAALDGLEALRKGLRVRIREAESKQWRRWILGAIIGSLIPMVKRLFRRPSTENSDGQANGAAAVASNRTEHAFYRSKALIKRLLEAVPKWASKVASFSFLIFGILYVFANEVELRVAKTLRRRLKRLGDKLRGTGQAINGQWSYFKEKDIEMLEGWRWRVLLWSD